MRLEFSFDERGFIGRGIGNESGKTVHSEKCVRRSVAGTRNRVTLKNNPRAELVSEDDFALLPSV